MRHAKIDKHLRSLTERGFKSNRDETILFFQAYAGGTKILSSAETGACGISRILTRKLCQMESGLLSGNGRGTKRQPAAVLFQRNRY
jgi:hypothetical protein